MGALRVNLKEEIDNSYDIIIEPGLLEDIPHDLKSNPANRFAIITDSNVKKLYGKRMLEKLKEENIDVYLLDFYAGEKSKKLNTVSHLINGLLKNGLDRKSVIIALGGGVVGDIGGFTASIFMRGISYLHVPTTLLAQIDSSIGGKTAVDTAKGKNLIGSFYQPEKVYIDPNTLNTLPKREFRNGLAEVIKYGIIGDRNFFGYLEKNINKIMQLDPEILVQTLWYSCRIKTEVVEEDPKEENKRSVLNYGHTLGHIIEVCSDYKYLHGEAVAIGMNYAGRLAVKKGFWKEEELERQNRLLKEAGLPICYDFDPEDLTKKMQYDKKAEGGTIMFVLPKKIGEMTTVRGRYKIPISNKEIMDLLREKK